MCVRCIFLCTQQKVEALKELWTGYHEFQQIGVVVMGGT